MDFRAILRVVDHFVPIDVLTSVLVVFSLENILDTYVSSLAIGIEVWAILAIGGLCVANLASMDEEERDELEEDLEDLD